MPPSPSLIEKYQRILQADPRSRIFVELARQLLEASEPARAAEVCERGVEHHPTSVQGRVIWGKALLALGRTDEALTRLEQAIEADPSNPYGYDLVGEILVAQGLAARALPLMEKGAALHPGDGRIRKWLAEARRAGPAADAALLAGMPAESGIPAAVPDPQGEEAASPASDEPEISGSASSGADASAPELPNSPAASLQGPGSGDGSTSDSNATPVASATPEPEAATTSSTAAAPSRSAECGVDRGASGQEPVREERGQGATPTPSGSIPLSRPPPLNLESRHARTENGAIDSGRVLNLIPEAPTSSRSATEGGAVEPAHRESAGDEEDEAAAAARTYEHELREKFLAESPPRPSFLRQHALGAGLIAIALAIAAGIAIFLTVRTSRRAVEAHAAVEAARKGLARDTFGALREAARVLELARRKAPGNAEAAAVEAEVAGLLAHDFGDAPARERARELLASNNTGAGTIAARWLVAEPAEGSAPADALLEHAAEGTPLARALAGETLLARRDREGARIHLEAAASSVPPMLRALAALGDLELARGDLDAALDRYSLVLRAHPTHPHAAIGAAEVRLRLGRDLPEALRVLEAVDATPDSVPALRDRLRMDLLLARLLAASGRTADAGRRLREAASRHPAQAEIAATQAEVLASSGDLDHALRSAEGATRLAPGDASYRELLVRLQLRRGFYHEVLAASETAPSRTLRLYRGIARYELGQPIPALAELEGTRRDGKMPAEAAGWMALAHLEAGHKAQAAAILKALLAAPSPHALALVARGRLDLSSGHPESAERLFREAVARDPDLMEARCDLGRTLLGRGRAKEARDELEKAVARNPYYLQARYELGRARLATGDAAGAVRTLQTVAAERPQEIAVLVTLSSAQLAAGNPDEARRTAERALKLAPRSAAAALTAGKAAAARGAIADARKLLELAAKLGGKTPEGAEARRALASLRRR